MKKLLVVLGLSLLSLNVRAKVPEFSLHVKLFINNDSARTVIFGYDPTASDSMLYNKETWFSSEFFGGEQLYPPGQPGDLDFRMSGYYVNRPELGLDGSDGGPIDIRNKPALDSFALQYGIEFHPIPGTLNAHMEWNPAEIPPIIRHITLASYIFPHTLRLDLRSTSSFVFPLKDSGEDLYSNMILTLYYNQDISTRGVAQELSGTGGTIGVYPNPLESRSQLHFCLAEDCAITLTAFDVTGRKVFERSTKGFAGENSIDLSRSDFSSHPGAYFLRIAGNSEGNLVRGSQMLIVR